jgi:hypothetical protein
MQINNRDFFVVPDNSGSWVVLTAGRLVGQYASASPAQNVAQMLAERASTRRPGVQVHVLQEDGELRTTWMAPGEAPRYIAA